MLTERLFAIILFGSLAACFSDTSSGGGSADGSTENSTSSAGDGSSSGSDTGATDGGTSDGGSSDATGSTSGSGSDGDSSGSTGTSEPPCTVDSCPDDEFCVNGICQADPPPNMIVIPAGPFFRGCNGEADCDPDESPADPDLFVSTFAIDRFEVRTDEYEACVADGACTQAGITEPECNAGRPGYESHPINCVSWAQAEAYCAWAVKRLPSEAEWEKAARGDDARRYAWGGDTPTCDRAVIVTNGYGCGTGETWPVGSKPAGASPYGVLNVAGNVREWVADWYAAELEVDVDDPQGPQTGTERVTRGAALVNGVSSSIRVGNRTPMDPEASAFPVGFRCAAG